MHRMIKALALFASSILIASPILAQAIDDPLTKAQQEVQTATNLARTADETWCQKADKAECLNRVHQMTLALRRASYAIDLAVAARDAAPKPTESTELIAEGDSNTSPGYSYANVFAATVPTVTFEDMAIGGSQIGTQADRSKTTGTLFGRLDSLLLKRPKVVSVLVGNNIGTDYLNRLWAYTGVLKAEGIKVAVGTILPNAKDDAAREAQRLSLNDAIRQAKGTKIDAVIDFAADDRIGTLAAANDPAMYGDGQHMTMAAHRLAAEDYSVAVKPLLDGTPAPKPTPPPATDANGIPQLPLVAPNYDRAAMLKTAPVPADNGVDPVGAFRLICAPSHLSYDDPLVYPGQPGKSHLHLFFGNTLADGNSTYDSLRKTGDSTCGHLNRSAYWMPALLDGHGNVILPNYATVYYKRVPAGDPWCQPGQVSVKGCTGLPRGLRYIFGRTMQGGTYPTMRSDQVSFQCDKPSLSSGDFAKVAPLCPPGSRFGVIMAAPDCWDGMNLNPADHRSHMATIQYGNDGKGRCPADFPYLLPKFTFDTWYTVPASGLADAEFSSDKMMGLPAGSTVHADWIGAWDDTTLTTWESNCIDGHKNGSGGNLCDGTAMVGAQQPEYGWSNPTPLVPVPAVGTTVAVN